MPTKDLAGRIRTARKTAVRLAEDLLAIDEELGVPVMELSPEDSEKRARALAIADAANRLYDILTAGLAIKEVDWLSEECLLRAATATGMDPKVAREALDALDHSGATYRRGGAATMAPMRTGLR